MWHLILPNDDRPLCNMEDGLFVMIVGREKYHDLEICESCKLMKFQFQSLGIIDEKGEPYL